MMVWTDAAEAGILERLDAAIADTSKELLVYVKFPRRPPSRRALSCRPHWDRPVRLLRRNSTEPKRLEEQLLAIERDHFEGATRGTPPLPM